jgi:tRNA pseudouridine38-40 synthase
MRVARTTLLLELAYNGLVFHGVAPQPGLRTVAGELQQALEQYWGVPMKQVAFSARTDAGVSAVQNFASVHFRALDVTMERVSALSQLVIPDLRVVRALSVPRSVHARNAAASKHYRYRVSEQAANESDPRCWHVGTELDLSAMQQAAQCLVGTRDFAAFRSSGCSAKHTVKHLESLQISRSSQGLTFDILGDAFLRKMARILVGTLVEVGQGIRDLESVNRALESRARPLAGCTAPAYGLELVAVFLHAGTLPSTEPPA